MDQDLALQPSAAEPDTTPMQTAAFTRSQAVGRVRSGVWQMILSQVVSSVTPLLLVSLYLRAWGPTTYGRWLALTSLLSYLSLLDLGGQTFIGNLAAIDFANGDIKGMREKLSEGLSVFLGIALAALFLLITVLLLIPINLHLGGFKLLAGDRAILLLMAGTYLLALPGSIFAVSYRSSGLTSRGTALGTYARLGSYVLYAAVLWIGVQPVTYAGFNLLAGILGTTIVILDAPKHIAACRGLRVGFSLARKGLSHLSGSLYFWLFSMANAVNQQGVVLVLAERVGADAVVTFVTHRIVANALLYISNIFQGPICPEMTFLYARGNRKALTGLLKLTLKTVVLISAFCGMALWFVAPYAYRVWTRHKVVFDPVLLAILLGQVILSSAWNTSGWTLIAVNKHKGLAYANSANAVVTIILALILVPHYGVYGAAVGSLLGDVFCGFLIYPFLAAREAASSLWEIYGAAVLPLLFASVFQVLLVLLRRNLTALQFSGTAVLILAFLMLVCFWFVFNETERKWLGSELRKLRPFRSSPQADK